jgi:hypothetical protein
MNRRTRLRAVAAAVAVLAFLVYLNLTQVDDESEAALRNSGVLSTNVERVIRERRGAAVSDAIYECVSLIFAGVAIVVAVGGDRIHRPRVR